MNNNTDDIIAKLRSNFRKIIHLYELKKEENKELKIQVEELKKHLSSFTLVNEELIWQKLFLNHQDQIMMRR
jgi:hypothetical protein